jgi:hypothetical protein
MNRHGQLQRWLGLALALVVLNFSLTFHNIWPTVWITTRHELSVEIALLVLLLAGYAELVRLPSGRLVPWLALVLAVLTLGRYAEVTAPALYGRPVNLYWDARHLHRLVGMLVEASPPWLILALVLALVLGLTALFRGLCWSLGQVLANLSSGASRRGLGGLAAVLVALHVAGLASPEIRRLRLFSLPVTATYVHQARFLVDAWAQDRASRALPPNTLPASDLGRVAGADVFVVFVESYGATSYDMPAYASVLEPSRRRLERAVRDTGREVVSAFVDSPTFGGASWLAHTSFMTGVEVRDGTSHRLMLTQDRDTLVRLFARRGHRSLALMPGLRQAWPEGAFFGFERIYGERALSYRGPEFGWWRVPDQFALAKLDEIEVSASPRAPLFVFFPTITTHMPFRPTPPYERDWARLLTAEPYDPEESAASLARRPEWMNLGPAYVDSLAYAYTWLAGYLERRAGADLVLIVLGDHQPAASVSGQGAPWEVPVHVIASRWQVLEALRSAGFVRGLAPKRPRLGPMHELTAVLLDAFDAGATKASGSPPGHGSASVEPGVDIAGGRVVGERGDEPAHPAGVDPANRGEPMALTD